MIEQLNKFSHDLSTRVGFEMTLELSPKNYYSQAGGYAMRCDNLLTSVFITHELVNTFDFDNADLVTELENTIISQLQEDGVLDKEKKY